MNNKQAIKFIIILLVVLVIGGVASFKIFDRFFSGNENLATEDVKIEDYKLIKDECFRMNILKELGKPEDYEITKDDLESLKELTITYITSLEGIEHCVNLEDLFISSNVVVDLTPLSNLKNLRELSLYTRGINDISCLGNLRELRVLDIGDSYISDLSVISNFKSLEELELSSPYIDDITPISNLGNLVKLNLNCQSINDISPLGSLHKLEEIYIGNAEISDISCLKNLVNLRSLKLVANKISDISVLSSLINLEELDLTSNYVSDVIPLLSLEKLRSLVLVHNLIEDVKVLDSFRSIDNFDVYGQGYLDENNEFVMKEIDNSPENTIDSAINLEFDHILFRNSENNYVKYEGKIAAIAWSSYYNQFQVNLNPEGDPYDGLYVKAKIKVNNEEEQRYFDEIIEKVTKSGGNFGVIGRLINTKEIGDPIYFTYNYVIEVDDINNIFIN